MDANRFELTVSVPHDARFTVTLYRLAVHAAQYAGCAQASAEAFGRSVEQALQAYFSRPDAEAALPVVLRRVEGPVEVVIASQTISVDVV